jgi:acyl-CoA synthetase (AMP-forming)/AMP-acid ligase II
MTKYLAAALLTESIAADRNGDETNDGRIKDMVIRGGENLYPREIEEFLYRHPKIAEVQIVGLPDPKYGEELCAWIAVREGEALTEEEVLPLIGSSVRLDSRNLLVGR